MGDGSTHCVRRLRAGRGLGGQRGAAGAMVLLAATFSGSAVVAQTSPSSTAPQLAANAKAEDFLVVDCLLPQQLRRLGSKMTFAAPRRALKTTTRDCEIRGGEYVSYDRANYATALKVWLEGAKQGDAKSQTYVGEIYEKGLGTAPDYAAAAEWYRRAAEQGYAAAAINLGGLYERGLGVARDPRAALMWYRRASGLKDLTYEIAPDPLDRRVVQLETEIDQFRRDLYARRAQPGASQRDTEEIQIKLVRAESDARALRAGLELPRWEREPSAPEIELLNVQVVEPQVVVASGGQRDDPPGRAPGSHMLLVVGRVASAASIRSFTINGIEQIVDASPTETRFRAELNLPDSRADRVKMVALDATKRRTAVELDVPARVQLAAATTGSTPTERSSLPAPPSASATYHALVIGVGEYARMGRLETAPEDARAVSAALSKEYGFKVRTVINASRVQIMAHLNELRERLTAQDNVLIYYAGRGELDSRTHRGYWLPADAQPNDPSTWISDVQLSDVLNVLPVRQLLVVADSPYAATLTRSANGRLEPGLSDPHLALMMQMLSGKRSRMVMTSGGVQPITETAGAPPSIFARSFIEVLHANGGVMLGRDVYRGVQVKLYATARRLGTTQVPDYAPIKYAGHDGGDFFFVRVSG